MTFSATDSFPKSSNVLNQSGYLEGVVSGGAQGGELFRDSPIADRLSNAGTSGLTYQFSLDK